MSKKTTTKTPKYTKYALKTFHSWNHYAIYKFCPHGSLNISYTIYQMHTNPASNDELTFTEFKIYHFIIIGQLSESKPPKNHAEFGWNI